MRTCPKAVSLLDLYPTLVELLDLPKPPQALDGNSLVPLLKDPDAKWDRPVRMTSQMDGVFFESILSNDFRMTRLATGETELYKLADDPHEFTNLAGDPEYAPVIEQLEKHLSFSYPEIPADGWMEAEEIPTQTSADYRLRGNCHYSLKHTEASGERLVCALLYAGPGSYVEFVIDLPTPGTYRLEGTLAMSGTCSVWVDDVKNDAAQADAGYPMKRICTLKPSKKLTDVSMGVVHFKKPGLKIIRFVTKQKQEVKLDRLRLLKEASASAPKKPGL